MASDQAVPAFTNRWTSVCRTPSASAASNVTGNDENLAATAAARAGITSSVIPSTVSPVMGARKIPVALASMQPSAQFAAATASGLIATLEASNLFSVTALVP